MATIAPKAKKSVGVNSAAKIGVELLADKLWEIPVLCRHHGEEGLDMVGHCLVEHRLLR